MGPPGIPSPGGMLPRTGLGAAAALCDDRGENMSPMMRIHLCTTVQKSVQLVSIKKKY